MKKCFTMLIGMLFLNVHISAQTVTPTVISSNGGYTQTAQGALAWTIGEPVSETYTNTANVTTNGFHQSEPLELADLIQEQGQNQNVLVYPVPVHDALTVDLSGIENGIYQMQLVDGAGKVVLQTESNHNNQSTPQVLSLDELSDGNYYLRISGNSLNKTVKINKIK